MTIHIPTKAYCEEVKAAYEQIDALEAVLEQCREFVEARADITDGDHGPKPNPAMLLLQQIEEVMP